MKDTKTIKRETRVAQLERGMGETYLVSDFCAKFGIPRSTISKIASFGSAKVFEGPHKGKTRKLIEITPILVGWAKNYDRKTPYTKPNSRPRRQEPESEQEDHSAPLFEGSKPKIVELPPRRLISDDFAEINAYLKMAQEKSEAALMAVDAAQLKIALLEERVGPVVTALENFNGGDSIAA